MNGINNKLIQKITIVLCIALILFNFMIPNVTYAEPQNPDEGTENTTTGGETSDVDTDYGYNMTIIESDDDGSSLLTSVLFEPLCWCVAKLTDGFFAILQYTLLGEDYSAVNYKIDTYIEKFGEDGKLAQTPSNPNIVIKIFADNIEALPNIAITPIEIFTGRVAALNANFFKDEADIENQLGGSSKSIVLGLKSVVSGTYVAMRRIAIVGLLSVLLYIGIRIIIGSSNNDKAKYKQMLLDWLVALCLIFFMHYIMVFIMTITDSLTNLIANNTVVNENGTITQVIVQLGSKGYLETNYPGLARILLQYANGLYEAGYTLLYAAFFAYTAIFALEYLKRVLMLAFLTLIAPLVAFTYPLDKIKDGHAQAFNFWFKEYIFYALLQVLHLLLYTVFVTSAMSLAASNMIYALVAMAVILPTEKLVKQIFGIRGQTEGKLGAFTGGMIAKTLFDRISRPSKKHGGNSGKNQENANGGKIKLKNPNLNTGMDSIINEPGLATANSAGTGGAERPTATVGTGAPASAVGTGNSTSDEESSPWLDLINDQDNYATPGGMPQQTNTGGSTGQQTSTDISSNRIHNLEGGDDSLGNTPLTRRQKLWNNAKRMAKAKYTSAGGFKGIALGAAKGYGRYVATGTAAMLGAGFGLAGDDLTDIAKYGIAGAVAGNAAAGTAINGIGAIAGATKDFASDLTRGVFFDEGEQYRKQQEKLRQQQEIADLNNVQLRRAVLKDHTNYTSEQIDQQIRDQARMKYDSGIDDDDQAGRMVDLKKKLMEEEHFSEENAHKMVLEVAKEAKKHSQSEFENREKYEFARRSLANKLKQKGNGRLDDTMADEAARRTMIRMAEIKGWNYSEKI